MSSFPQGPPPPSPLSSPGTCVTPGDPATLMQSRVPELLIITIITAVCATVFVFGRLYTRLALTRNSGYDDIFLAVSWLLDNVLTALICVLTKYGVGKHVIFVPISDSYWIKVLGFCVRIIHVVVLTTTKVSICFFYRRIFQDRLSSILLSCLMAIMTVLTVTLFIEGFFACEFGGAFWSPAGCGVSFPKSSAFFVYGSAALSVSADIFLMAFALWRIIPLSAIAITRAQKISLYAIISLGWLAIAASLVRAIRTGETAQSLDPTWAAYDIDIWASVEVNVGLVCASAPALKPLIRKFFPKFLESNTQAISSFDITIDITGNGPSQATPHSSQVGVIELRSCDDLTAGMTNKEQSSTTSARVDTDGDTKMEGHENDANV